MLNGLRLLSKMVCTAVLFGSLSIPYAFSAGEGEGCDTIAGREEGQQMCDPGLVCTGPFEGIYGHGNCQKPKDQSNLITEGTYRG